MTIVLVVAALAMSWAEEESKKKLLVPYPSVLAIDLYNSTHVSISPVELVPPFLPPGPPEYKPFRSYFFIGQPGPLPVSGPFFPPYLKARPNLVAEPVIDTSPFRYTADFSYGSEIRPRPVKSTIL